MQANKKPATRKTVDEWVGFSSFHARKRASFLRRKMEKEAQISLPKSGTTKLMVSQVLASVLS